MNGLKLSNLPIIKAGFKGGLFVFVLSMASSAAAAPKNAVLNINGMACEETLNGESLAGARIRASDKAVFNGIKRHVALQPYFQELNDHDSNVFVYRLADEYIEDLSVRTMPSTAENVCVEIKGHLPAFAVKEAYDAFVSERSSFKETKPEVVEQIVEKVEQEIALTPDNPNDLALLYIDDLTFFDGTKSAKQSQILKQLYADNPYFYLTEDAEIADYVIHPKVLTAKVDKTGENQNRLHMVVILEVEGLTAESSNEYQNRYVVFDDNEDKQNVAVRMLDKLMALAGQSLLEKIEDNEQRKLEQKALGRELNS